MNSLQTLSKWFYTGLIMVQVILLILKFTGITIFGVNVSEWSLMWLCSPAIIYASFWFLSGLSESLSNIFKVVLTWVFIIGFLYLLYYIYTI